jgi:hypothetical protein
MRDVKRIAQHLLAAIAGNDADAFEAVIAQDAGVLRADMNVIKSLEPDE